MPSASSWPLRLLRLNRRSVSTSKKTPSLTAPAGEQRPEGVINGMASGLCRAQPAENMVISWTEPFQKQVGHRQSRKAKMLRPAGYGPVTPLAKTARNLAFSLVVHIPRSEERRVGK